MGVRLAIDEDRLSRSGMFVIAWFGEDEEGPVEGDLCLEPPFEDDDTSDFACEHALASKAAAAAVAPYSTTPHQYTWETLADARKALKAANGAIKAYRAEKKCPELPEWAKTAIANGWKAPKGWKP